MHMTIDMSTEQLNHAHLATSFQQPHLKILFISIVNVVLDDRSKHLDTKTAKTSKNIISSYSIWKDIQQNDNLQ